MPVITEVDKTLFDAVISMDIPKLLVQCELDGKYVSVICGVDIPKKGEHANLHPLAILIDDELLKRISPPTI